ncbi:3D-(3,5/4)-trihydroxycyclohexane-1,2-dione acylhydrolase (decyclizing) [Candidatus Pelagibacter sp.]|jgi:3D-(3,5/4)-trihydroxycyclohexane-1,2-dione acylhydrolase (decyclizing)|nr:3D-(3,5/4)-trihydroxycyclohexane-1,2-dione acylhydrolase (decyclizing) [Candidatus Pelagibacter sp.]OCW79218.1 TPP-dependent enzyme,TPP-dependent enzyme,TPP-dependent enzyme [Pelagibacteraceae bacterium GOM-A2]|tara:strand:- start:831 stop:2675 length:1845 start_codon:yes stop_codon:yes gene_type:complete
MKKIKLTCAHAIIKHLIAQKILIDGKKEQLFAGAFGIFGHGNVACLGQALQENQDKLPTYRGHHEQNMALTGIAYARAKRRKQFFVATSSVGPGSTNMVTASAVAMSNRLPILFLPGDTYANRMPDPVLQQVEHFNNPGITQNDAFKPVTKYFDRITRPEQILQTLPQAIQTMLDPADCGPACLSLSQDVQGETYEYPEEFFKERVHNIRRPRPDDFQIKQAAEQIKKSKNPLLISGGGVFYSDAMEDLSNFAIKHNIPVTQTVMGYSTMKRDHSHFLGPIGGLGGKAANNLAKQTDLAIAVGTKLADFTTGSWANFENPDFSLVSVNVSRFDASKHLAQSVIGDAKVSLQELSNALGDWKAPDEWHKKSRDELKNWNDYVDKESGPTNQELPSYAHAVGAIYRNSDPTDIAVTAAGGLVGEVVQIWRPKELNTHETEWGFSCMSYEISGALGVKMANPDKEVIAFVGDGSYLLFNSDIYSSVITNNKLIIVLCDNGGHAVINRLQLFKGGKEFNCLFNSSKAPNLVPVNFAKHAESMGAKSEEVSSISELEEAFKRAKKSDVTYLISIKTHSYEWLEGSAYWESPTLEMPSTKENEEALKLHKEGKSKQRQGV